MNCNSFEEWIALISKGTSIPRARDVESHLESCILPEFLERTGSHPAIERTGAESL
jgi:hypothetical protein